MLSPVLIAFPAAQKASGAAVRAAKRRLSRPAADTPLKPDATVAADTSPAPTPTPSPAPARKNAAQLLHDLFSIDLRSLALFRICLALMLLADLGMRAWDMEAFYTDFGVLPRSVVPLTWNNSFSQNPANSHLFSLHLLTGSVAGQTFLFLLAAVFAVLLLVGWQTRLFAILSWVMLVSIHWRNPLILQGGDVLLRMLLFWGLFLPLGAYFSLDAARDTKRRAAFESTPRPLPAYTLSVASVALLLQVAFMYWFSAALKTDVSWRTTGTAIDIALRLDQFVTPVGRLLRQIPLIPRGLTFATFFIETLGPALAFLPVRTGPVRTGVIAAFWAFHLIGLNMCLELGHFPYVCAIAWMAFLPAWFWDYLLPRLRAPVLRSRVASRLVAGWDRLALRFGATEPFRSPNRTGRITLSWPGHAVAAFYLAFILLWNLRTVNWDLWVQVLPYDANKIGEIVHADQSWGMFAPKPMTDDGWMVLPGKLRDKSEVDVYRDAFGAPSYAKPRNYAQSFRDERWRKYLNNLWSKANAPYRVDYGRYLCRRWNRAHAGPDKRGPKQLITFQMYYMMELTRPDLSEAPPVKTLLWDHCCLDGGCGGAPATKKPAPVSEPAPKVISLPVTVTPLGPSEPAAPKSR